MIIAEYLWLDADNNFRSKIRVMDENNNADWNFDGSSTNQATTESSEVILKVVYNVNHPFLDGRLYLCATYDINDRPLSNTYYEKATDIFNSNLELKPWFGLEQEYFIYNHIDIDININSNSNIYYCSPINQDQDEVKITTEHLEEN